MKKTLKVLVSAIFIIAISAVMAFAAEDKNVYVVSKGVEFVDQWNKAAKVNGTVKLDRDVNINNEYKLDSNRSLTIDLNGYSIKGTGTDADYIFNILSGSSMTVKDSSEKKNGRIAATRVYEDYEEVILVSKGGNLTLESGTLLGNEDDDCRIVSVEYGTFTMNGGSVTGNTYDGDGAGIYVNEGSFYMNGGTVSNNRGDSKNDYGGGVFFDGSTTSKLVIKGGEFFGNYSFEGGAIYLDDGYSEITGGRIYKNSALKGPAILISGTSDSVKLAGDLVVTENKSVRPTGELTNCAAVHANIPGLSTSLIYFGGRLKIYGNYPSDFCADFGKNKIHIMEDLDVSPENHAWIGMSSFVGDDYIDYTFEKGFRKEYTACFFGNEVGGTYYEPVGYTFLSDPYVMGISHKTGHVDEMKLNESGIRGTDGTALKNGTDYLMSYDSIMREFTINTKQSVALDDASKLLTNKNSKCNGSARLVKTDKEETFEGTTYTYYYLCEYYLYAEPYLVHNSSYNIVKESYYTVKVFVENPKFFKDCTVNGNHISGIAPNTDAESFAEKYLVSDKIEITVNTSDGIAATGSKITVKCSGKEYRYTTVVKGDLNGDGKCDAQDISIAEDILGGMFSEEDTDEMVISAADMNGDGEINAADIMKMEIYSVSK